MKKYLKKENIKQRFIFFVLVFIFIFLSSSLISGYTKAWFISQESISFEFEMNMNFEE